MMTGIVICMAAGLLAMWLGALQQILGAPIIGLFLGIIISNAAPKPLISKMSGGCSFCAKYFLRIGIILVGGTLSFNAIIETGRSALPYILFSMSAAFIVAFFLSRRMKVSAKTGVLIGGGTAVCGGTAIAALSAIIKARKDETAYAITAIFLFDIIAALLWPYVAAALNFSPEQFGLLAGVAINNVASVSAAGETFNNLMGAARLSASGASGGDLATITKLTRVALLIFVAVIATIICQVQAKRSVGADHKPSPVIKNIACAFPYYVLGFLLLAICNTALGFSTIAVSGTNMSAALKAANTYFITAALIGIGCGVRLAEFFSKGVRPMLLGGITWAAISILALLYVSLQF